MYCVHPLRQWYCWRRHGSRDTGWFSQNDGKMVPQITHFAKGFIVCTIKICIFSSDDHHIQNALSTQNYGSMAWSQWLCCKISGCSHCGFDLPILRIIDDFFFCIFWWNGKYLLNHWHLCKNTIVNLKYSGVLMQLSLTILHYWTDRFKNND